MREPDPKTLASPLIRRLVATRPGFLGASLVPVLIGVAAAAHVTDLHWASAVLSLVGALAAHAGINVLNDVYDHRAGCDEFNVERFFPYTGGSRVIQNAVLSPGEMARLGYGLLLIAALSGIVLMGRAGAGLLPVGLAGLLLGWAYSAPPLRLSARGLGELCVGIGFGVLIPVGTAMVQSSRFEPLALCAGAPYGLLITAVLFINQYPDYRADADSGKRNLVVKLGREGAWPIYPALTGLAYLSLPILLATGVLPPLCLLAMATAPLHAFAALGLRRSMNTPAGLERPIRLTLVGTLIHGALVAVTLAASA